MTIRWQRCDRTARTGRSRLHPRGQKASAGPATTTSAPRIL